MTTIQKATNYQIKNNGNGTHSYWLSFDGGKSWRMVSREEYVKGRLF